MIFPEFSGSDCKRACVSLGMASKLLETGPSPSLRDQLQTFIGDRDFPCVGAKSALANDLLRVVEARDLTSGWNDLEIHRELLGWARAYKADPTGLRSPAAAFPELGRGHCGEEGGQGGRT